MSLRMTSLVWNLEPDAVTSDERLILLCLADYCNRHGRKAWPAWSTIARRTSMGRTTVGKCLNRLKAIGVLVPSGRTGRGTIVYNLNQERLAELQQGGTDEADQSAARTSSPHGRVEVLPVRSANGGVRAANSTSPPCELHPSAARTRSGIEPVLNRNRTVATIVAKSSPAFAEQAEKAEKTEAEIHAERLENMARLAVFLKTAVKSMP